MTSQGIHHMHQFQVEQTGQATWYIQTGLDSNIKSYYPLVMTNMAIEYGH